MSTRFVPQEVVSYRNRPATILFVDTSGDSPRYTLYYNDTNELVRNLLGRVIDTRIPGR
jgi:hypothetical protein